MEIRHSISPHIKLMDHQLEGIRRFILNAPGYCNFCEPGTGKTLMAIGAMNHLAHEGKIKRVLVLCPPTVKDTWAKELSENQEFPWDVRVLSGTMGERAGQINRYGTAYTVLITNYESLLKLSKLIDDWSPDLIIADEAHLCKTPTTLRTKALKTIRAKYKWAMTGTYVSDKPLDVWSIVDWAKKGHLQENFYIFRNYYCIIYMGKGYPDIRGYKNLDELKAKLDAVNYRRIKEECMDLPKQTYITREVQLSCAEARMYKNMADSMVIELGDEEMAASTVLVKTLRLQQLTSGAMPTEEKLHQFGTSKLDALQDILESLEDRAVIVWCQFKHEVDLIIKMIGKDRKVYRFTGDETLDERMESVRQFQASTTGPVLVGTIKTGGIGITLTNASEMVFFSTSWSAAEREQAEDRIHRKGQQRPVTYYDIVAKGTIDSRILKVLKNKEKLSSKLTGDDLRRIAYDLN